MSYWNWEWSWSPPELHTCVCVFSVPFSLALTWWSFYNVFRGKLRSLLKLFLRLKIYLLSSTLVAVCHIFIIIQFKVYTHIHTCTHHTYINTYMWMLSDAHNFRTFISPLYWSFCGSEICFIIVFVLKSTIYCLFSVCPTYPVFLFLFIFLAFGIHQVLHIFNLC